MKPDQIHELAMAVKVLCDVRLACSALMVVAVPAMGLGPEVLAVIGASLAMSYVLLRHWDPLGARLVQGWVFPSLESLVAMLLFVEFGNSGLGGAYLGATLALLACAGGVRAMLLSFGAFIPIVVLAVWGVFPTLGGASVREWIWLLSLVILQVACGLGGFYLRTMLFSRVDLVEQRRAVELVEASSRERLRLAHELHDGVSKSLHGCHMIAESLSRQLAREDHPQTPKARELTHSLDVARQESRDLLYELRQVPADDLVPPLRSVLGRWAEHNPGVEVHDELGTAPVVVTVRVRHEVARAVGELLENVRRHSGSTDVRVTLAPVADGHALLTVADTGVGMAVADPERLKREGHFGLAGVQERAELVGGSCRTVSGPGGTRVQIGFPVVDDEERGAA
ncbi:MAG: histidine kinase [Actinobacteria bacterium]|nr:histidine kinase [Actinomycetota bacterium]